ncbi:hypothetical protein P7B02_11900 [Caulobacter segnis]|uniref:hypothetical protein n=1 Tax=Caulobacter segnis TaxID=88688 RepID=UPI00240EFA86|nr:hypothetical protein [Caulobacter segnis]MDG2522245.1 hypothetical protein [Caulobacter segnis]
MIISTVLAAAAALSTPSAASTQDAFFRNLTALCGKRFAGKLVSSDAADAAMRSQSMLMHVRDCSATQIRIPFQVGADRSRTWVITRTEAGLRLKHDHRHEDGTEDALSQYGGDTADAGSAMRQAFPADAFSKTLFTTKGNPASVTNVWAVEVLPGEAFTYSLARQNRDFRVRFDLSKPLAE